VLFLFDLDLRTIMPAIHWQLWLIFSLNLFLFMDFFNLWFSLLVV
jgi:hypothetical protein